MIDKKLLDKYKNIEANQKTVDRLFQHKHLSNDGYQRASELLKPTSYKLDILTQSLLLLSFPMFILSFIFLITYQINISSLTTYGIIICTGIISMFVFIYHDINSIISKISRLIMIISVGLLIYKINNAYFFYELESVMFFLTLITMPIFFLSWHVTQLFLFIVLINYSIYFLASFHISNFYDDSYMNLIYLLLGTINLIYLISVEKKHKTQKNTFMFIHWTSVRQILIPTYIFLLQKPVFNYIFQISNTLRLRPDLSFTTIFSNASLHENWLTSNLFYVLFIACVFRLVYHFYKKLGLSFPLRVIIISLVVMFNTVLTIGIENLFLERSADFLMTELFQYYTSPQLLITLSITTFISFSIGVSLLRMINHKLENKGVVR
jgi:hypothetical protein